MYFLIVHYVPNNVIDSAGLKNEAKPGPCTPELCHWRIILQSLQEEEMCSALLPIVEA